MFVLDTDVLSELRRRRPNPNLQRWLEAAEWEAIATTAITIMEIRYGIETARLARPDVAATVEEWLRGLLDAGGPQIFVLDAAAAQILGRMYAIPQLRQFYMTSASARQPKTGADLAIAAIAISRKAVVATNNVDDFLTIHRYVALTGLFNPLTGDWHAPPVTPG